VLTQRCLTRALRPTRVDLQCSSNVDTSSMSVAELTLNLLTTSIVAPPSNASKWQMEFNSAFKGLISTL